MRQLKITQQITSRESISLNKYLVEVGSIDLLTPEEELALALRLKDGDEAALKKFVEANLRFVISVAKQHQAQARGEKLDDLISAGNEGLLIAAKKFDTSRGFKFISYAVWWIRQSILQYLAENGKSIRLPANKLAIVNKIKRATNRLEQRLERNPTVEEIGQELFETEMKKGNPIDSDDIEDILAASSPISSLDMKLNEDSEFTLIDMIVSDSLGDVNHTIKQQDLQSVIKRVLNKRLSSREKEIVVMSFGLFGQHQKTLEEIGRDFDLTRERVRQIREKALRKLRYQSAAKEIKEYV